MTFRPVGFSSAVVAVIAAIAMCATAFAAAVQAQTPMIVTITPDTIAPGDTTTVNGDQCGPDTATATNHQIIATLVEASSGVAYGSTQGGVSATGTWSVPVTADAFAPPGDYEIRIVCQYFDATNGFNVGLAGAAVPITLESGAAAATMTVTPSSGIRPLTVTVTGSSCGPTDATTRTVTVELLDPSLTQVDVMTVNGSGGDWSTTFTIATARINPYTVRAVCNDAGGAVIATYPDQRVAVTSEPAALTVSPASALAGDTISAATDRCPDPDLPRLGGRYFVEFTFEPGPSTVQVSSDGDGEANTTFAVPAGTAPGTYNVTATCNLEELGSVAPLFSFPPTTYVVTAPGATVTPVPTATATPTPTPTSTGSGSGSTAALAYQNISGLATATVEPGTVASPTPVPTPATTPRPAAEISFTG